MLAARLIIWATMAWISIVPLAIANGLLRQFVLGPWLGLPIAQPISGVLLILLIAGVAWAFVRIVGPRHIAAGLAVGLVWGLATFVFECVMLFSAGKGFSDLVAQYDFTNNNIWPLVLLWTIVAPGILARCCGTTRVVPRDVVTATKGVMRSKP